MKYDKDLYIDSGFYDGDMDGEYQKKEEKIVKCRKPHKCMGGCGREIQAGEQAVCEKGFEDGKPVSCYTCLECIERWLEESGQVESEDEIDEQSITDLI